MWLDCPRLGGAVAQDGQLWRRCETCQTVERFVVRAVDHGRSGRVQDANQYTVSSTADRSQSSSANSARALPVPVPPIKPISYPCNPSRAARPADFRPVIRGQLPCISPSLTLLATCHLALFSFCKPTYLRRLTRNLALQLGRGDSLQVRAAANKVLVDVDVRDGALAVKLFEVRLDLGYMCQRPYPIIYSAGNLRFPLRLLAGCILRSRHAPSKRALPVSVYGLKWGGMGERRGKKGKKSLHPSWRRSMSMYSYSSVASCTIFLALWQYCECQLIIPSHASQSDRTDHMVTQVRTAEWALNRRRYEVSGRQRRNANTPGPSATCPPVCQRKAAHRPSR